MIEVWAVCNGGVIKQRAKFKYCLSRWAFMSWFHRVHGGNDIDWTPQAIGRRRLLVQGMEQPVVVRVRGGKIVIEEG